MRRAISTMPASWSWKLPASAMPMPLVLCPLVWAPVRSSPRPSQT